MIREHRRLVANRPGVDTCWFCERRPAAHDTAYRATVYGDKKNGRPVRDAVRASAQRRESAITVSGLALGTLLLPGAYAATVSASGHAPFLLFGSTAATLTALAILGFLEGLASGVAIAALVVRGRTGRDPRTHPEIVALAAAGWSYDPPATE
jgi:hypothetical protein